MAAPAESAASVGSACAPADERWACNICFELLLDPLVGACGHDACRHCLERYWRASQQVGATKSCPVCRQVFATTASQLGVCVRLRDAVEERFPARIAARRAQLQEEQRAEQQQAERRKRSAEQQQAAALAAAAPPVPRWLTAAGEGRRYLVARRSPTQPAQAQRQPPPAQAQQPQPPQAPAAPAWAPVLPPSPPVGDGSWPPPAWQGREPQFTLGWSESSSSGRRRSGQRSGQRSAGGRR